MHRWNIVVTTVYSLYICTLNTLKALHRLAQYIICVCKKRQIRDCLSVTLCSLELTGAYS